MASPGERRTRSVSSAGEPASQELRDKPGPVSQYRQQDETVWTRPQSRVPIGHCLATTSGSCGQCRHGPTELKQLSHPATRVKLGADPDGGASVQDTPITTESPLIVDMLMTGGWYRVSLPRYRLAHPFEPRRTDDICSARRSTWLPGVHYMAPVRRYAYARSRRETFPLRRAPLAGHHEAPAATVSSIRVASAPMRSHRLVFLSEGRLRLDRQ